jgi:hypothetical protein
VRSFLPAARRPGLNRGARKVRLTSVSTGRCAGDGEEGGAASLAMKKRTAARAEEAEQLRTSSMFLTCAVPDLRRQWSLATPVDAGSLCLRASSLPPTPLPSLSYFFTPPIFGGGDGFGLGSSSPGGGGGTGKTAGAWSLIGGRLGFGGLEMDGGWRFREVWQASRGTSTASGSHGAGASSRPPPCPHRGNVTGGGREEEKQDMMADVWAPLGGDKGEGGRWEAGRRVRWAERPNGLAV